MEIAQTTSQSSFFGFGIPVIIASYHDGDILFFWVQLKVVWSTDMNSSLNNLYYCLLFTTNWFFCLKFYSFVNFWCISS